MVAALALTVAPATALAQSSAAPLVGANEPNQIPGQYIVVLKNGRGAVNADRVERRARNRGARVRHQYRKVINGFAANLSDDALADVRSDADVAYVEPDTIVTADATQANPTWGLDRIDQRNRPLDNAYTYNATGLGVKAYIIDTGLKFTHNEFGGRATSGVDEVDGGTADDCNGHGTHVAGTVGGSTYGVAKQVSIVAVRVLGCNGSGSNSGVIAGINWVTADHQPNTPAVANMSLGGSTSTALDQAVANSVADGVTYAVAAGNDNTNACTQSPARAPSALTVGATTSTDARSSFSNYGTCVDIFAPGSSITSAWYTSNTATNTISGTSMASPHVAGVAALYLQGAPTASPATVSSAIINGSTPNVVTSPGSGSPNRLLYSQIGTTPPPPPPPPPPPADTTPPDTTITSGPAEGSTTTDNTPTFAFTSTEAGSTFECQDDNGAWAACTSPSDRPALTNASHTFRVRATDAAGNTDATPAARTYTVAVPASPCGANPIVNTGTLGNNATVTLGSFSAGSGTQLGCLTGPAGRNFNLALYKRGGFLGLQWVRVASATGATATENIAYNGTSGTYRWEVSAVGTGGAYRLESTHP